MKKVFTFIVISILAISCLFAEVSQKALATSFTAAGECFIGFSRKNVTNTIKLQATEQYGNNGVIGFTFDPVTGYYSTDVFYAYCQSFVNSPLIVKVSAPSQIYNETNTVYDDKVSYELIYKGNAYNSKTGLVVPETKPEGGKKTVAGPAASSAEENNLSGVWVTDGSTISFTHDENNDTTPNYSGPRVVMSQPISIRIKESTDIARGKKYSITFTLEVSTNA